MNAHCKACDRPILWGQTIQGKWIALDLGIPVYAIRTAAAGPTLMERVPAAEGMSLHFATCPKPEDVPEEDTKNGGKTDG